MFTLSKALVAFAAILLVLAVWALLYPIMGITGESFSRASNNVALIAIALALFSKKGPGTA